MAIVTNPPRDTRNHSKPVRRHGAHRTADGWDLIAAARRGDTDAIGEIYRRYARTVSAYVRNLSPDRALVEDVTNETFLRFIRSVDRISYQGKDVGAWLMTVARNILLDHLKSASRRYETVVDTFG